MSSIFCLPDQALLSTIAGRSRQRKELNVLGDELRRIRKVSGLTLRDVEEKTNISNAYLSQLESGSAKKPSADKLAKLARVFNVPSESLLGLAGYIETEIKKPSVEVKPWMEALLALDLDEEDERLLTDYVAFLHSRKSRERV